MPKMLLEGKFLGFKQSSFTDKDTGKDVRWGAVFVWDDEQIEAVRLGVSPEYLDMIAAEASSLSLGDPVRVQAQVHSTSHGVRYKCEGILEL